MISLILNNISHILNDISYILITTTPRMLHDI